MKSETTSENAHYFYELYLFSVAAFRELENLMILFSSIIWDFSKSILCFIRSKKIYIQSHMLLIFSLD